MDNFEEFPKLARYSRYAIVTEKIDGTNAQILITDAGELVAGSRSRFITVEADNYGFARWCQENREELLKLGPGRHFGEWWGGGIQRTYGLKGNDKRFSLFNVTRWSGEDRPACCGVVPVLWRGDFGSLNVADVMHSLSIGGSVASPGFMRPEGIVIFHTARGFGFKKTFEKDGTGKWDK
jgi:hypothetical protein